MLPISLKGEREVVGIEMQCHIEKTIRRDTWKRSDFLSPKTDPWQQCISPTAVKQTIAKAVTVQRSQNIPQSHRRKETSSIA